VPEGGQKPEKPEDSAFAKFNVRVAVPQYNDDQYASNLQHADWTKEEADYLLALVREYDLRWPLMWDRYDFIPIATEADAAIGSDSMALVPAPKPRTMEDLKARYYEVVAKCLHGFVADRRLACSPALDPKSVKAFVSPLLDSKYPQDLEPPSGYQRRASLTLVISWETGLLRCTSGGSCGEQPCVYGFSTTSLWQDFWLPLLLWPSS
jgi:hypothetical protein